MSFSEVPAKMVSQQRFERSLLFLMLTIFIVPHLVSLHAQKPDEILVNMTDVLVDVVAKTRSQPAALCPDLRSCGWLLVDKKRKEAMLFVLLKQQPDFASPLSRRLHSLFFGFGRIWIVMYHYSLQATSKHSDIDSLKHSWQNQP